MRCKVKDCDMELTPHDRDEVENYVFLVLFFSNFIALKEKKTNILHFNLVVREVISCWAIVYEQGKKFEASKLRFKFTSRIATF